MLFGKALGFAVAFATIGLALRCVALRTHIESGRSTILLLSTAPTADVLGATPGRRLLSTGTIRISKTASLWWCYANGATRLSIHICGLTAGSVLLRAASRSILATGIARITVGWFSDMASRTSFPKCEDGALTLARNACQ